MSSVDSHIYIILQPANSRNYSILNSDIKHSGFVKEIRGNSLIVNIVNQSACSTCHAKGACTVSDFQDKEIEISNYSGSYSPGEEVTVVFKQTQGFVALLYGYIFPFFLVLLTLIVSISVSKNELLGGLISLAVLIPYYTTLYFFRKSLKKVFKFEVEEKF